MTENQIIGAGIAGVVTAAAWLFRMVLTNNRKVALLEQALVIRREQQIKTEAHLVEAMEKLTEQVQAVNLKLAQLEVLQDVKR